MLRRLDGSTLSHATVVNDGRIAWSAAYGLRQKDPDLPMERESITWTASITKTAFGT